MGSGSHGSGRWQSAAAPDESGLADGEGPWWRWIWLVAWRAGVEQFAGLMWPAGRTLSRSVLYSKCITTGNAPAGQRWRPLVWQSQESTAVLFLWEILCHFVLTVKEIQIIIIIFCPPRMPCVPCLCQTIQPTPYHPIYPYHGIYTGIYIYISCHLHPLIPSN